MNNVPPCIRHFLRKQGYFTGFALLAACLQQYSVHGEVPPNPPLITTAPNPCAWTLEVQHKKPRPPLPVDPTQAYTARRLRDVYARLLSETVEKAGEEWHRQKFYDNQKKDDIWVCKGFMVFHYQGYAPNMVNVTPSAGRGSLPEARFGLDFPELAWVSAKFFVGTVIYNGQKCHLYQNKAAKPSPFRDTLTPSSSTADVSVWINAQSRLPVAIEDDDVLENYTFRAGPATIQPTGIFTDALNRAIELSNKATTE